MKDTKREITLTLEDKTAKKYEEIQALLKNGFPPVNVELTSDDIERLKHVPKELTEYAIETILAYRLREMQEWRMLCNPIQKCICGATMSDNVCPKCSKTWNEVLRLAGRDF